MEQELTRAHDELATQRSALDKAWAEEKDLKRLVSEMTTHTSTTSLHSSDGSTDTDNTHTDTDTHTHKDSTTTTTTTTHATALSKGLAGIKQDFQQRESVLQATNKQLQEALTRTTFEAGLREDSLRQELGEMRKRWQDAVSRTEGLAADMHESTAPLLRQIKALQEETRHKAQAWYVYKRWM
jgi:hypothetical protein